MGQNYYSNPPAAFDDQEGFALQTVVDALDATSERTLGRCLQNALALGSALSVRGIECDMLWGGYFTKDLQLHDEGHGVPTTIAEAEAHPIPCTHFWIEVPRESAPPLVVETASEARAYKGQMVILPERPTRYMVFPQSRRSFSPSMSPGDFEYLG